MGHLNIEEARPTNMKWSLRKVSGTKRLATEHEGDLDFDHTWNPSTLANAPFCRGCTCVSPSLGQPERKDKHDVDSIRDCVPKTQNLDQPINQDIDVIAIIIKWRKREKLPSLPHLPFCLFKFVMTTHPWQKRDPQLPYSSTLVS